jgi:sigma-B regulation protein RsbU (phosphoserine phosphatase)
MEPYVLLVPLVRQDEVLGVLALGAKLTGGRFHAEDMALLNILSQQLTTAIENVRLVSENVQKRILDEEINLATEIQEGLLPTKLPQHPLYASHGVSFASKFVGGDYYDLFLSEEGRLHLAIADVSGKGVPAALLMSSLRAALHSNVAHVSSPSEVVSRINRLMYESTAPEKFATFFYGVLDTNSHELVYSNAGHNYPLVVRSNREPVRLTQGGLILGAFANAAYEEGHLTLEPGDTLFMYTDGVTEATDDNEEDFGEERLQELLCHRCQHEPRELVEEVLREVRAFTHGAEPGDDVTMLVIQRCSLEGNGTLG